MLEINKAKEIILQELTEKYMQGNKKALSDILSLFKSDIFTLLDEGISIRSTKKIIEKAVGFEIKDDTFYKWVRRNYKRNIPLKGTKSPVISKTSAIQAPIPCKGEKSFTEQNRSVSEQENSKNAKKSENRSSCGKLERKRTTIEEKLRKDIDLHDFLPEEYK